MNDSDMVRVLRRVRHDFGNNLQVIMSYIDLNRYEAAKAYILDIADSMAGERNIFEQTGDAAALYLYGQMLMARDLDIILGYNTITISTVEPLQNLNEPFNSLKELTKKLVIPDDDDGYVTIGLSIYQNGNDYKLVFEGKHLPDEKYECLIENSV